LGALKKGDERKLLLAGWIKAHYAVSNTWLAERLQMGHPAAASRAGSWYRRCPKPWHKAKAALERGRISKCKG
jgi:hypothetical protein